MNTGKTGPFAIGNGYYWPNELERNADIETFVQLYRMKGGFEPSENSSTDFEPGIEKIALYVNSENEVTHAARQKENGAWTSKLGELEDIEHQKVDALYGKAPAYGVLAKILKRPSKK